MADRRRCKTCRYHHGPVEERGPGDEGVTECRRHPPVVVQAEVVIPGPWKGAATVMPNGSVLSVWPSVDPDLSWCGDHEEIDDA